MLVILNPNAGGGTALQKWGSIEPTVRKRLGEFNTVSAVDSADAKKQIQQALGRDETELVAAGGDGTVNMVASTILENGIGVGVTDGAVTLGAIGLGSSNDYHKPFQNGSLIAGIPCKLDFRAAVAHDVCTLCYSNGSGDCRLRFWMINASVGTTAVANEHFNHPDPILRFLKNRWTNGAIGYAALCSIIGCRSRDMTLTIDGHSVRARIKNLGIVKNPHFSGDLWYDSPYEPDSGRVYVHLLPHVPPWTLFGTLMSLTQGRFSGREAVKSCQARTVTVRCDQPFAVECDGEVLRTTEVGFAVLPRRLRVCAQ